MIDAVTRIKDGNSTPLTIICHCPGVIQAVNQSLYTKWSMNGWKNSKGEEVECVEEWQRIVELFKDKVKDVTARAPHSTEDHIMQSLGAEQYEGHLNIA